METGLTIVAWIAFVLFIIHNVLEIVNSQRYYKKMEKELDEFIKKIKSEVENGKEKNNTLS